MAATPADSELLLKRVGSEIHSHLKGPWQLAPLAGQPELQIPFVVSPGKGRQAREDENRTVSRSFCRLRRVYTPWVRVAFAAAPGCQSVRGICKFYLEAARMTASRCTAAVSRSIRTSR